MRKLYIIRENEEDGKLLDALIAAGRSTDEGEFENPVCPLCGSSTLVAYVENGEFEVVTWYCLSDKEGAAAESWHLVCGNLECTWEEQVERVQDPMGALFFDVDMAHNEFDEYCGLISRDAPDMLNLIAWLKGALEGGPNRKLQCFLEEAEWRYKEHLKTVRKWIDRVPPGKLVKFRTGTDDSKGTFVTATEQGFMILTDPHDLLKQFRVEDVFDCLPRRPDRDELSPGIHEVLRQAEEGGKLGWIAINCAIEYVVVKGHHLQLDQVDKFGQYHVRAWSEAAGVGLGMTQKGENYWEATFRRSDIESRYDIRRMVKVKGYWVDTWGTSQYQNWPAVRTTDPAIASALGLEFDKPWSVGDEDEEARPPRQPTWSGVIPEADVEDRREVRLYHWPLPEFPLPESR